MEKISFTQPVYTYDIDFAGHVSNITYIRWMEIGRLKLLAEAGMPVDKIMKDGGIFPTLAETKIRYKRQLFLGDTVTIELWLSRLKHISAIMEFQFYNQQKELAATGQQVGLFVDTLTNKPVRLNSQSRQKFEHFLIPPQE